PSLCLNRSEVPCTREQSTHTSAHPVTTVTPCNGSREDISPVPVCSASSCLTPPVSLHPLGARTTHRESKKKLRFKIYCNGILPGTSEPACRPETLLLAEPEE
ncbi:unnamed protein product, partial [Laminaria digitata]